jgi:hypothetical protein
MCLSLREVEKILVNTKFYFIYLKLNSVYVVSVFFSLCSYLSLVIKLLEMVSNEV